MACFVCGNIELSSLCDCCGLVSACSNHIYLHCNDQTCFPFKIGLHKNKGRYVFPKENPIQICHKLRHSFKKCRKPLYFLIIISQNNCGLKKCKSRRYFVSRKTSICWAIKNINIDLFKLFRYQGKY